MINIDGIIAGIIAAEGGYSDNPHDTGGKTMYGITERVAREYGYTGEMRDLPKQTAQEIYYQLYVVKPGFDKILLLSPAICFELVDTGVNCGTGTAAKFLQRVLNGMNRGGTLWENLTVDGGIGAKTVRALAEYMKHRKNQDGERVMVVALNCLQGAHYLAITEKNESQEEFFYGWLKKRVADHC